MSETQPEATREFSFPVPAIKRLLLWVVFSLSLAGLMTELHRYVLLQDRTYLSTMFNLSYEKNVPTWFSGVLLMTSGLVLAVIAMAEKTRGAGLVGYWWGLSAAFTYISLDEMVSLHENLGGLVDAGGGFLYYDWVIPAGIVVAIFGLLYLRFLFRLPEPARRGFVISGTIYVSGAMGVELILGYWTDLYGIHNLGYGLIDLVEETLEMVGVTLFLCTLLDYLGTRLRMKVAVDQVTS